MSKKIKNEKAQSKEQKVKGKSSKWIIVVLLIIIVILICIICNFMYEKRQEEALKNTKYYSEVDKSFYLQDGKLFIFDIIGNPVQVPGDFSQMTVADYEEENHQSNPKIGNVYFYYKVDDKIYLVMSNNTNFNEWTIKELTSEYMGIPSGSAIKCIRISGNYGYIFYVDSEGAGKVLKSTTEGDYWQEVGTDFTLNDNCTLKFLNKFGMTFDGFLTVPSEDGEECDLYRVDNTSEATFVKIDLSALGDSNKNFGYYSMPTYLDDSGMAITMYAGESKDDANLTQFVSTDDGATWKTMAEYQNQKAEEAEREDELKNRYDQMAENLDQSVFLTDFENYNVDSDEVKISEEKAKQIAEKGFQESAARIAGEGIRDTEEESIEIREVSPNNYFTRKHNEGDDVYTNIKRKAYVVTKKNNMGNGVMVYVDVTTGLIIGGAAFGD